MCLVAVAWQRHAAYPLIIAGNRDELHARPAAAADWWEDDDVFAGRDLVAGGTWLGVSRSGRFAVVTNYPGRPPSPQLTRSRGELTRGFLTGQVDAVEFASGLAATHEQYASFCLIVGDGRTVERFASPPGTNEGLGPGIHTVSNSTLDAPWPKAGYLSTAMHGLVARDRLEPDDFLAPLTRRGAVDDPAAGEPDISVRPFVFGHEYGTRASTVVLLDADGNWRVLEHTYNPQGEITHESAAAFQTI